MKIPLGLGTDITNISRFKKFIFNERFISRILTNNEKEVFFLLNEIRKINFLAKRFSGKEAFSKALGVGIGGQFQGKPFTFTSIEILNNSKGAPIINLLDENLRQTISRSFISYSDEKDTLICTILLY